MIRLSVGGVHLALTALLGAAAIFGPALAADKAQRIVTLGGSVTEIAVALGAEDRLVGRDSTSTYPDSILDLPDVGYIRALSPEGVLSINPDLILSEAGAGPAEAVDVLRSAGVPFLEMPDDPTSQGVIAKITSVAAALDDPAAGAMLAATVADQLAVVEAKSATVKAPKRVLFLLSLQGGRVMAGGKGSSADGIIRLAGGVNAATGFDGYKPMTDEAVITAAPDVILMMDREGNLAMSNADVLANPALATTPAAKAGAIIRMEGMLLLGFGPRTPQAASDLHAALYGAGE